jgi:hypothetical protein
MFRCLILEFKETYALFNFLPSFCDNHPVQHSGMGQVSCVIPICPADVQQTVEIFHGSDFWSHWGYKERKRHDSE